MNKVTRILHVVGAMNRGGTETMLMNLYRNLNRDYLQFDFISYSEDEAHYDAEIKRLGGRIYRLSKTNSVKQLYHVIKKHGPYQAVHAHTLYHSGIAVLAAYLAGVKIRIAHAHTTSDYAGSVFRHLYRVQMRMVINQLSTHLLACSRRAGAFLYGEKALKKRKYTYFPNVIEYEKFLDAPTGTVKRFKRNKTIEDEFVIGHIGTFNRAKNHTFLIDILENMNRPTTLLLVGDGELRSQVETEVYEKELTRHVHFLGIREDIPTILHSLDVFVFPSIYEGLGLVLLEAQASGVPCVVSEAIQPEADLGLGLLTKIPLEAGAKEWAAQITKMQSKPEMDPYDIMTSFETKGYAVRKGIRTLLKFYQVNIGEINEANIDRVV